jgi:hypothetical protein
MHQVFAAVRVWQLSRIQKLDMHAQAVGRRIFKSARWNAIWNRCMTQTDERDQLLELCFGVLQSSGWKDDDRDQTRTMTNMELASITYVDEHLPKMDNWPIYVEDQTNPQSMVGIEQVFDVTLNYEDNKEIRYVGTIDGLVIKRATGDYYLDENKTAARLGDAWRDAFDMRHQLTGYCAASTAVFGFEVYRCRVTGLRIKPTNKGEDVYPFEPVMRTIESIDHWFTWVREMVETYERYQDDYEHATRYTHSCNRYFRPCSLLPFCADHKGAEGRRIAFDELMIAADPSPSERAVSE